MASHFVKNTDQLLKELRMKLDLRKVGASKPDSGNKSGSGEGKDASAKSDQVVPELLSYSGACL